MFQLMPDMPEQSFYVRHSNLLIIKVMPECRRCRTFFSPRARKIVRSFAF